MSDRPSGTFPLRWLVCGLVAVLAGLSVLTGAYDLHRQASPTMGATLAQGDVGLYAPVAGGGDVRRGDVVRFRAPWSEAQGFDDLVFRVVAVGGDEISGDERGRLSLDGAPLVEPYLVPGVAQPTPFTVRVPAGRVFLAGDSRSLANDSRLHRRDHMGTVDATAITGRLVGVAWPPTHWGEPDGRLLGLAGRDPDAGRAPAVLFHLGGTLVALGFLALGGFLVLLGRVLLNRRAEQTAW